MSLLLTKATIMGSKSSTQLIPEHSSVRQDYDPEDLPAKLVVGINSVICQAAVNPSGETVIALVTPEDVLARHLHITSNSTFGKVLRCGEGSGQPMEGPNKRMKLAVSNFGRVDVVAIQFLKEKRHISTRCCKTYFYKPEDFVTMLVPKSLKGHLIVFYWPDDYIGNGFMNFPLKEGRPITTQVEGVKTTHGRTPGCLLTSEDEAAHLRRAIFKL